MSQSRILAIDVGGTKVEVASVSTSGDIGSRHRIETNHGDRPLMDRILNLLENSVDLSEITSVGIGCGGPSRNMSELVSPLNIPEWRDFPLVQIIQDHLSLPCHIDNDAKALALAEGRFGAARGVANYVSMVVSTGIGGGVVLDGNLVHGREGNAGHIGHVNVIPDGRECTCGGRGCLEAEASGTAIRAITGSDPAVATLAIRERTGQLVGRAIGSIATLLDCENFFVAGSVALGYGTPFFEAALQGARQTGRVSYLANLTISPSGMGANGPLLGAAAVALNGAVQ